MRVSDCVSALRDILVSSSDYSDFEIVSAVNNASSAVPGCLFCAIRGAKFDGHDFLADAVKKLRRRLSIQLPKLADIRRVGL